MKINWEDVFPAIAKIAPQDKRFATAVLAAIAAPVPREEADQIASPGSKKRLNAISQLKVIEADTADKVKALISALGDGVRAVHVIGALGEIGKDAETALPLLQKLKNSPKDAVRNAAVKAIAKIE